jgi:hypothetical protein
VGRGSGVVTPDREAKRQQSKHFKFKKNSSFYIIEPHKINSSK